MYLLQSLLNSQVWYNIIFIANSTIDGESKLIYIIVVKWVELFTYIYKYNYYDFYAELEWQSGT